MRGFDFKEQARLIFTDALRAVDAGAAVRRAVKFIGESRISVVDEIYELTEEKLPIYAIAIGKAAYPMALALDEVLGGKLISGVISGALPEDTSAKNLTEKKHRLSSKWRIYAGGHPLPNEASLAAAQSCFNLLREANNKRAIIIFLVSGGGSAMLESPSDKSITLADLRKANRALVSCGASITEINVVRRAFSRIKGGGLAARAPLAAQISLIISDTEPGDEASVASGPTIESAPATFDELNEIVNNYNLSAKLPDSVLKTINQPSPEIKPTIKNLRRHHVLLDNQTAVAAAAQFAESRGLTVEIAHTVSQQNVEIGCAELLSQMNKICRETSEDKTVCLISGGEFSCPVRGGGTGGRNLETTLRMALMLDENSNVNPAQIAFLSAGTDGIDGNSPAAGAVCDQMTLTRARNQRLDSRRYLENSDSYAFFQALNDNVITRPTGTNVRDLRIMIVRK